MGEHLTEDRRRLYRDLGLEELLEDYPDHAARDESAATEIEWATHNSDFFVQFFRLMEKDPEKGEMYEGYGLLAKSLARNLQSILTTKEPKQATLSVKPGKLVPTMGQDSEEGIRIRRMALDQDKLYDGQETTASQAFRLLAYKLTRAETAIVDLDDETGYGRVVMAGESGDKDLYFVEEYGRDELGNFISWTVMNYAPFITTSSRAKLREDLEATEKEIEAIATIEVDDGQIIREYFDHNRAA